MPKKDRRNREHNGYADHQHMDMSSHWDSQPEDDDVTDFARREQGAKRETVKRARTAEKQLREERDAEFSSRRTTDKRAIEKDLKRRYNDLKRLANQLGIKDALQDLNNESQMTSWGPDVIGNKTQPSLAVVLNYLSEPGAGGAQPSTSLFGAWLYFQNDQAMITVATKTPTETESHSEQASPPAQRDCILVEPYDAAHHDAIRDRVFEAIRTQGPIS